MSKLFHRAVTSAAVVTMVAFASLGATQGVSQAVPLRASTAGVGCQATSAAARRMSHPLWVILRRDLTTHYAPALRSRVWRKLTSNPVTAYRVVNRISHARVLAATCAAARLASPSVALLSAPTSALAPSGQLMPTGDTPGWHQVFADNFTQNVPLGSFPAAVASKWGNSYPDGWTDTTKNGTYMPSKVVSIANGVMNLNLHTENGVHMVAAPVPTIPGAPGSEGGLLYGRYVIRFRADAVPGYKTAWLLWPDSETWPADGEIDFPEGNLNGTMGGFVHHQGATSGSDQAAFSTHVTYTGWHTATLTWLPSGVTFQLDGQTVGTTTTRVPNTPMHLVIQTETSTDGTVPTNSAAGNVQIDWLAVYTPA
jgi:beta-glucanase (GH16 family)